MNIGTFSNIESTPELQNHVLNYMRDTITSFSEESEKMKGRNIDLERKLTNETLLNEGLLLRIKELEDKNNLLVGKLKHVEIVKAQLKKYKKMEREIKDLENRNNVLKQTAKKDEELSNTFMKAVIQITDEKEDEKLKYESEIGELKKENKMWRNNFEQIMTARGRFNKEKLDVFYEMKQVFMTQKMNAEATSPADQVKLISSLFDNSASTAV